MAAIREHERKDAEARNAAIIGARVAALTRTYDARIARRQQIADSATNPQQRAMFIGQVRRLRAEKEQRIAQEQARTDVGATSTLLAQGVIRLTE
jgi:hypothetical protein